MVDGSGNFQGSITNGGWVIIVEGSYHSQRRVEFVLGHEGGVKLVCGDGEVVPFECSDGSD